MQTPPLDVGALRGDIEEQGVHAMLERHTPSELRIREQLRRGRADHSQASSCRNTDLSEAVEGANEGRTDGILEREKVRDERRAAALKHPEPEDKDKLRAR